MNSMPPRSARTALHQARAGGAPRLVPAQVTQLAGTQAFRRVVGADLPYGGPRGRLAGDVAAGARRGRGRRSGLSGYSGRAVHRCARMLPSWRLRTVSCGRTSILAAVGWLEKSLGQMQDRLVDGDLGGPHRRGGSRRASTWTADCTAAAATLAGVGLAVDDREALDLDHVEHPAQLERDEVRLKVRVAAADPQPQQRVVEHGAGRASRAPLPASQVPGLDVAQLPVAGCRRLR